MYKYTNQSSKYTNGTFHLKSPNVPDDFFFYQSITAHIVQSSSTLFMAIAYLLYLGGRRESRASNPTGPHDGALHNAGTHRYH